jgi:hypothetical protein
MSFALGIWLVYKPFHSLGKCTTEFCLEEKLVHDNETMKGVLSQMFWLVFDGDGSTQRIQHWTAVNNTMQFSKEFSHPMGLSLWAMYQGIICILLINILIAMMNTTYENVWKNVDGEWKFSKSHFQVQYLAPRATMPPPFRWFYYFARIMRYFRSGSSATTSKEQIEEKVYLALVRRLVRANLQSESKTAKKMHVWRSKNKTYLRA